MTCGTCIRWRKRPKPANEGPRWRSRYGSCMWPGIGPAPYWHAEHPTGDLMTADCHGDGCEAFKEKRR